MTDNDIDIYRYRYRGYGVLNILLIWLRRQFYFFLHMIEKLLKGPGVEVSGFLDWHFSDSHSYDMSSTSKYKQSVSFR